MKNKKPTIVLILSFVLAAIIMFWGIAYNYGSVEVESNMTPFYIEYGNSQESCQLSPCTLKLKPKTYDIVISADNYTLAHEELKIERGIVKKIEYSPFLLPTLTQIQEVPEYVSAYFSNKDRQSLLYLKTVDQGDILVSTFKSPLQNPKIKVSSLEDYIIVWDADVFPVQAFLIDVPKKSKKSLSFKDADDIKDLKFMDSNKILIEYEKFTLMYLIEEDILKAFPISVDNYIEASSEIALVLSNEVLDEYNNQDLDISLEDLLDSTNDEGEFNADNVNSHKLYYYFKDEEKFIQLLDLNDQFQEPFKLFYSQIEEQPEIILQSNDKYYQVELGL